MTDTTKRAAIYARVSDKEKQGDNYSLPTQIEECLKHTASKGYSVVETYREMHTGTELERPELDKLRALAREGKIDVVVVLELDRLSRKRAHQWLIEDEFERYDVTIEYALADYADDAEGRLFKNIRGDIAEYEREKIVDRTKRGRRGFAKAGKIAATRIVNYGYRYIKKAQGVEPHLEIDPAEAAIICMIFEWFVVAKLTCAAIAARLTEMHVPTAYDRTEREAKRDHKPKGRKIKGYGVWSDNTIQAILENEIYAGVSYYGKTRVVHIVDETGKARIRYEPRPREEWIAIPVDPIISRELWQAARRQAEINSARAPRRTCYEYLLRSMLKCSRCGYSFTSGTHGGGYLNYSCGGTRLARSRDGKTRQCHGNISARKLDNLVWEHVKAFVLEPEKLVAEMQSRQDTGKERADILKARLEDITARLVKQQQALERTEEGYYVEAKLTKARYDELYTISTKTIRELEIERDTVSRQLDAATISTETIQEVYAFCQRVRRNIEHLTFAERRHVLEVLNINGVVQRGETRKDDVLLITGRVPRSEIPIHDNRVVRKHIVSAVWSQSTDFPIAFIIPLGQSKKTA